MDNSRETRPSSYPSLHNSAEYLTRIINALSEPVLVTDESGRIIMVNDSFCAWENTRREEAIGKKRTDYSFQKLSQIETSSQPDEPGEKMVNELTISISGQQLTVIITKTLFKDDKDRKFTVTTINDVTEERKAQAKIASITEMVNQIVHIIEEGIIVYDKELRFRLWNRFMEKMSGRPAVEVIGKKAMDVFPFLSEVGVMDRIKKSLNGEEVESITFPFSANMSGKIRWASDKSYPICDSSGQVTGVIGTVRDITEQKHAQEIQMRVEILESLGILAGGIAHDFNNLLTGIMGNASLANMEKDNDKRKKMINEILEAAHRATSLTRQLMEFAKGGVTKTKLQDVSNVVKEAALFALGKSSKAECIFQISDELWMANIDSGQIGQVIQNLVINANQAMPDGGIIYISAQNIKLEKDNEFGLNPSFYIQISVKDTGIGIQEKFLEKIFDPYFTTKGKTHGTGLGLAVSHSIIQKHHGYIGVTSEQGVGSTFSILLPAEEKTATEEQPVIEKKEVMSPLKILIMDDEPMILLVLSAMLKKLGHSASMTKHGAEAIECYEQAINEGAPFDMVFLDLTIPGKMGGVETLKRLKTINPSIIAIISSGFAETLPEEFSASLPKPYTQEDVRTLISQLINKS